MRTRSMQAIGVLLVAILYWLAVNALSGTAAPWDAPSYWTVRSPLALVIAALAGFLSRLPAWLIGGLVVFAQLPVMLAAAGIGPLIAVGLLLLGLLAVPATLAAWLGARLRG